MKVKVDKQEEFIIAESCLLQLVKGEKFIPGLIALTGKQILVFNDYAPSEKIADLNVYHPVFSFGYSDIKTIRTVSLYGNDELKKFIELDIIEKDDEKKTKLFFNKKIAKKFDKVCNKIKKVGKIKIESSELDCYMYN